MITMIFESYCWPTFACRCTKRAPAMAMAAHGHSSDKHNDWFGKSCCCSSALEPTGSAALRLHTTEIQAWCAKEGMPRWQLELGDYFVSKFNLTQTIGMRIRTEWAEARSREARKLWESHLERATTPATQFSAEISRKRPKEAPEPDEVGRFLADNVCGFSLPATEKASTIRPSASIEIVGTVLSTIFFALFVITCGLYFCQQIGHGPCPFWHFSHLPVTALTGLLHFKHTRPIAELSSRYSRKAPKEG